MGKWDKRRRDGYDYWGERYDHRPTIKAKGRIKSQSKVFLGDSGATSEAEPEPQIARAQSAEKTDCSLIR
jgi:hypothetical protein